MTTTLAKAKWDIIKWSVAAAFFAGVLNILSLFLMNYQLYIVDLSIQQNSLVMNYPSRGPITDHAYIFFQFFFLTPMCVVAIARRYPGFTFTYVSILFIIFAGRLYYLVRFYRVGLDGLSKFDAPQLLWTILSMISSAIVAIYVVAYSVNFIRKILNSDKGQGVNG